MEREEAVRLIETMIFSKTPRLITDDDKRALIEAIKTFEMSEHYESMRPRGKWLRVRHTYNDYECSLCGLAITLSYSERAEDFKFCPHCGGRLEVDE